MENNDSPVINTKQTSGLMLFGGIVAAAVILIGSFLLYTSVFKSSPKTARPQSAQSQNTSQGDELSQEASQIDSQINEVSSLQTNVDQGLNDQQGDLSE